MNFGNERIEDLELLCSHCHDIADAERGDGLIVADINRLAFPLVETSWGKRPAKASDLTVDRCPVQHARLLNETWHSRLPKTQFGPWMAAYRAAFDGVSYAVALWNSPSARTLPSGLIELRRMAVAPDAPHCTASRFLNQMVRRLRDDFPTMNRAISYQDAGVHTGTIYRAADWELANVAKPRARDRSGTRVGTRRDYRSNLNGDEPDHSAKIRWEKAIR